MIEFHHLREQRLSYCQHFSQAFHFAWLSWKASLYLFCHAFYPDVFEHKGSQEIGRLYSEMMQKLKKQK